MENIKKFKTKQGLTKPNELSADTLMCAPRCQPPIGPSPPWTPPLPFAVTTGPKSLINCEPRIDELDTPWRHGVMHCSLPGCHTLLR